MRRELNEYEPVELRFTPGWWILPGAVLGLILIFGASVAFAGGNDHTCQGSNNCTGGGESGDSVAESASSADAVSGSESVSNAISGDAASSSVLTLDLPRTRIVGLVGGASGSTDGTAPCLEVKSGWFGVKTMRAKRDDECWTEYKIQAEHERQIDLGLLELERIRVETELERTRLERIRLEQCTECAAAK